MNYVQEMERDIVFALVSQQEFTDPTVYTMWPVL